MYILINTMAAAASVDFELDDFFGTQCNLTDFQEKLAANPLAVGCFDEPRSMWQ